MPSGNKRMSYKVLDAHFADLACQVSMGPNPRDSPQSQKDLEIDEKGRHEMKAMEMVLERTMHGGVETLMEKVMPTETSTESWSATLSH